jgi:hypothetical protein
MLRLKRTFTIMLLMTIVPAAYAQSTPAKVKIGDVEYSVTSLSRGRMLQIGDRDGHMIGMAGVNGGTVSVLYPQQEPAFSVVRNVATEYLHPANGAGTAAANTTPPPSAPPAAGPEDPNAAARAALMAKLDAVAASAGNLGGANPLTPVQLSVEFPAAGGAIVHGTKFGDITFNADATEAHFSRPTVSGTPEMYVARYLGGDKPSSAAEDVGIAAKNLAKAGLYVHSARAVHIRANDNTWEAKTQRVVRGKIQEFPLEEAGGAVSSATGRDAGGERGDQVLEAMFSAEQFATTQAKAKTDTGEKVAFDPESTPRGKRALQAIKGYEHAN